MLASLGRTEAAITPEAVEALGRWTHDEEDRNEPSRGKRMLNRGLTFATATAALGLSCVGSYAGSCTDLTGTYVCEQYCPTEGIGGYDKVVQDGDELQLSNGKTSVKGYLSGAGARAIIATWIWKENPLKGTLNADCSEIDWMNGSVWVRKN
jgi:hypothetical protein